MTNVHIFTVSHDTLPSIAETYGHSGEWQMLWSINEYIADPAAIYPGMEIEIPDEWTTEVTPATEPTEADKAARAAEQLESHARTRSARDRDSD
jgi:hypothetical protein